VASCLTQEQRDECISVRKQDKRKRDDNDKGAPQSKIAALESQIKEMKEHIVSGMSSQNTPLPPAPTSSNSTNPPSALHPPHFTQRE